MRRKPYTAAGIRRRPCFRCGEPGYAQWQVCADQRIYRVMCAECDIALNALVLRWAGDPDASAKMLKYARKVAAAVLLR